MRKYVYKEAQQLIQPICEAAAAGNYDTREKFYAMMNAHPDIAVQGYNSFGKIFFWNKPSAHLYGYSETAAVNRDLFETIIPPEMRPLARDQVQAATKTGRMPKASVCELLQRNGGFVTVFSGHLIFHWDHASVPEFYCIDVEIQSPAS